MHRGDPRHHTVQVVQVRGPHEHSGREAHFIAGDQSQKVWVWWTENDDDEGKWIKASVHRFSSKKKSLDGDGGGSASLSDQGPGWSGNAAALAEQRDQAVHSSQQKIKVVISGGSAQAY